MKQLSILCTFFILLNLTSCSDNEEPAYQVFMQPSSIQSMDAYANNQTFEYDDYGRIVKWNCINNSPEDPASYSAQYSYPDRNTIIVKAEEVLPTVHKIFEETIQLKNGRASNSEGTLAANFNTEGRTTLMSKSYRLAFEYLPTNHLNTVEHIEIFGIGDEVKDADWDNGWRWMNYLIWENGNLKEFQDYQGNSSLSQSIKYEYSVEADANPIVIPIVINSAHHMPLCMQGVFGLNSVNLVKSASTFDDNSRLLLARQYSYEFDRTQIRKYTEILFLNSVYTQPVTYTVTWTEK